MWRHTYLNLRYGILHSLDYVTTTGHVIHDHFDTIYLEEIVWC